MLVAFGVIVFCLLMGIPLAYWRGTRRKPVCRESVCDAWADPECGSGYCTYHCSRNCRNQCYGRREPKPCRNCGMSYYDHANPKCTTAPTYYEPK